MGSSLCGYSSDIDSIPLSRLKAVINKYGGFKIYVLFLVPFAPRTLNLPITFIYTVFFYHRPHPRGKVWVLIHKQTLSLEHMSGVEVITKGGQKKDIEGIDMASTEAGALIPLMPLSFSK
ncbi:uncharacterized protein BDW43DRAFT_120553 [Aspergillus alliaceus]|uniref:uncharacterized protein n=1 Tax=Petromyces alliaceus TaxID=209559 RepID=UPI0012A7614A|nr:uncharacterized protein BDW43DRAFT_120553 [Aspergillus alliaceus]KAB8238627.1 hypothetical protein BDW43DRAFT_120553 [Aspergillus alliaceus]